MRRLRDALRLRTRLRRARRLIRALGAAGAVKYVVAARLGTPGSERWLLARGLDHPVCLRSGSSDADVFLQVLVDRDYACLDDLEDVRFIIDCGANVGYSAAYLLSRHPGSCLIAVEPDPDNFGILERNLAPFGDRAKLLRAGVWSGPERLAMANAAYRDGREWTKQVRPCAPDEPGSFEGVDIGTLLKLSGEERISVLKMDIEGAEAVVFAGRNHPWLDKVDTIAIELHDDSAFGPASQVFFNAIAGHGYRISRSGELTVCRRQPARRI